MKCSANYYKFTVADIRKANSEFKLPNFSKPPKSKPMFSEEALNKAWTLALKNQNSSHSHIYANAVLKANMRLLQLKDVFKSPVHNLFSAEKISKAWTCALKICGVSLKRP